MVKLSVVIIAFNEEKNIERCLKSVSNIADEIVVVDSGSTDKTVELSRTYNAIIVEQEFLGHIEQKNFALTHTSYDLCLSLDADEALTEELENSILQLKEQNIDCGYTMNRLTNYCGKWIKHCGWYPDVKLRLWNKNEGKWSGTNPHDKFVMRSGIKVNHIKGDILHYSFYTVEQHMDQIMYFTDISSKALFKQGKKSNTIKIIFSPVVKFLRDYIWKKGFLDGYYGFIISKNSAYAKYLKYTKLRKLQNQ